MHDLSIAISLVEVASEEAERLGGVRVEALHLRLGPLSGVVRQALEFSFDVAAQDTPLAGARLAIEEVPVIVRCAPCGEERRLPDLQHFRCPVCGEATPETSARTGQGMAAWLDRLAELRAATRRPAELTPGR